MVYVVKSMSISDQAVQVRRDFFIPCLAHSNFESSSEEGGKKIKIKCYFLTICSLSKMGELNI
jgi:hypothetical protein